MALLDKTIQTRISLKYDEWSNWKDTSEQGKKGNLVLKKGEVAFCEIPAQQTATADGKTVVNPPHLMYKVGNGTATFAQLPWGSAIAADVHEWAKLDETAFNAKISGLIADALQGDRVTITGYVTTADFNAFKTDLEKWKSGITNSNKTGRLDVAENEIAALKGADSDTENSVSIKGAKKYADEKDKVLLGASTDNGGYVAGTEGATRDKETIRGAINIADAALTKAKANATNIDNIKASIQGINDAIGALDDTYATDTELAGVKSDLEGKINTKVEALEGEDTRLAGLISSNAKDINNLKTAGYATTTQLNEEVSRLKGTDDDTKDAETIAGAKAYADAQIDTFYSTYIENDTAALDTLKDVTEWLDNNKDGAADIVADITALQNNKLDASTFNDFKSDDFADVQKASHEHDNKEELDKIETGDKAKWDAATKAVNAHTGNNDIHVTTGDRTKWDAVTTKADQTALDAHIAKKDNPHEVTAAQVGAYTTAVADDKFATKAGLADGTIVAKTATNATNDGDGNSIKGTYETKTNVDALKTRVETLEGLNEFIIDCGTSTTVIF